jgi:inorganic pyrophosphatase
LGKKKSYDQPLFTVVETPKWSRNKYKFDDDRQAFKLAKVMPAGAVFPYDFGYIPDTLAEDGDPIDVLLIMEESAFPGCLVETRLLGVIVAEQTEGGKTNRNDRLVGVATRSPLHGGLQSIEDLEPRMLDEIEHFFCSYNEMAGRQFRVTSREGPEQALKLIKAARSAKKRKA